MVLALKQGIRYACAGLLHDAVGKAFMRQPRSNLFKHGVQRPMVPVKLFLRQHACNRSGFFQGLSRS